MAKKNIAITLYLSELIYDIENKTYLTGRSRSNGNNHEEVANMQVNEDDENANQILRSIGNAYANLKAKLSEYMDDPGSASSNLLMNPTDTLTIELAMPSNFNQSVNDTLSSALHQYIVNLSIGEWFTITNKADAADYVALATANLEEIRDALNRRKRPIRPEVNHESLR